MKIPNRTIIVLLSMFLITCRKDYQGMNPSIVKNSIDSIIKANTRMGHFGKSEIFWENDFEHGERRKQWIYTDSIEKYCSIDNLIELYKYHESAIIRMVAFHLLLKNSPKDAICFAIEDMDNTDSLLSGRCDEALLESSSSIRTRMIQQWPKKYDVSVEDSLAIDSAVINSINKESNWHYLTNLKRH